MAKAARWVRKLKVVTLAAEVSIRWLGAKLVLLAIS
jgi:hypothetical protein